MLAHHWLGLEDLASLVLHWSRFITVTMLLDRDYTEVTLHKITRSGLIRVLVCFFLTWRSWVCFTDWPYVEKALSSCCFLGFFSLLPLFLVWTTIFRYQTSLPLCSCQAASIASSHFATWRDLKSCFHWSEKSGLGKLVGLMRSANGLWIRDSHDGNC